VFGLYAPQPHAQAGLIRGIAIAAAAALSTSATRLIMFLLGR
jgi:hypothetical protein